MGHGRGGIHRKTGKGGNSGGTTRGRGQNFRYGRSVSDNTNNRGSKQNDFDSFRKTASEGGGRRR